MPNVIIRKAGTWEIYVNPRDMEITETDEDGISRWEPRDLIVKKSRNVSPSHETRQSSVWRAGMGLKRSGN